MGRVKRLDAKAPVGFNASRRAALVRLGHFAAYTAPIMTTLLVSSEASATHNPARCNDPPITSPPGAAASDAAFRAAHCTVDPCTLPNPPPECGSLGGFEAQSSEMPTGEDSLDLDMAPSGDDGFTSE